MIGEEMEYIPRLLIETLAVIGGSTVTLTFISKFVINKLSEIISSIIELEFSKKKEKYKGEVNKKTQINQFRFNKEFEILQYLVSSYYDFTHLSGNIIVYIVDLENDRYISEMKKFSDQCNEITKYFYKNCALIDKSVADSFENSIKIINRFQELSVAARKEYEKCEKYDLKDKSYFDTHFMWRYNEMKEINKGLNDLKMNKSYCYSNMINEVRDYLNSFEIV